MILLTPCCGLAVTIDWSDAPVRAAPDPAHNRARAERATAQAHAEAGVIAYVAALLHIAGFTVRIDGDIVHAARDGFSWECAPNLMPSLEEADRMAAAIIAGWERRMRQRAEEAERMVPRWSA